MIRWKCERCGTILRAHDSAAGRKLPCPKCQCEQTVPRSEVKPEAASSPVPEVVSTSSRSTPSRSWLKLGGLGAFSIVLGLVAWAYLRPAQAKIGSMERSAKATAVPSEADHQEPLANSTTTASGTDQTSLERDGLVDDDRWKQYRKQNGTLSSANVINVPATDGDVTIELQDPSTHPLSNEDYYQLALMASQFYRQGDRLVRLDPEAETLAKLRASKSVRVSQLFQVLDQSLKHYAIANELQRRASRLEDAAMGNFLGSLFSSDSDTLVATEMSEPGMIRVESLSSYYTSEAISSGIASFGNRANAEQLMNTADAQRLTAWKNLKFEAERIAKQAKPMEKGIELAIVRKEKREFDGPFEQVKTSLQGKQLWIYGLRAVNNTNRDLRNVTLAITLEAVPAIDGEREGASDQALSEPNFYFIKHWPAQSALQLLTGNQWGSDGLRRSFRGTVSLWSAEDHLERVCDFDDNLDQYAKGLVQRWNGELDHGDFETVLPEIATFQKAIPERLTELHEQLTALSADAKILEQKLKRFQQSLITGAKYEGSWSFGKFSEPMAVSIKTGLGNSPSAWKNQSIVLELYEPNQPALYRRLAGPIFCSKRHWQVQLVGQADSGNRGIERTGTTANTSLLPHCTCILDKEGPSLMVSFNEVTSGLDCRSPMGDVIQLARGAPSTSTPEDNTKNAGSMLILKSLPEFKPLPSVCFSDTGSDEGIELGLGEGEIARGTGDSNGLYAVEQVFIAPLKQRGLSLSRNGEMRQWNLSSWVERTVNKTKDIEKDVPVLKDEIESSAPISMAGPVATSNSLQMVASFGDYGKVRFWDLTSKREPKEAELGVVTMQIADRGTQQLLIGFTQKQSLCVWNDKGKVLLEQKLPVAPQAYRCSPDGKVLAAIVDNRAMIWQIDRQKLLTTVSLDNLSPSQVQFSEDGTRLMMIGLSHNLAQTSSMDTGLNRLPLTYLAVYDIASGETLYRQPIGRIAGPISISADWKVLIHGTDSGPIIGWDLTRGLAKTVLIGHRRAAASVAVSPSGHYAISGGAGKDTCVIFWRIN